MWLQASRPKTLWAALAPVLIGTAMAIADDAFHALSAIAALAVGFLMQIGTNFSNDLADFKKGADTSSRVGPQRVTQAGLVTPRQMSLATALVFGVALIVCGYLMT
ncbi:MAG: UbiA family prenyltransferase, partial [Verrucomicrobia bacterium]|nr:UbiA family prenyltransferase [Verrucomicrobiota bacterium]